MISVQPAKGALDPGDQLHALGLVNFAAWRSSSSNVPTAAASGVAKLVRRDRDELRLHLRELLLTLEIGEHTLLDPLRSVISRKRTRTRACR